MKVVFVALLLVLLGPTVGAEAVGTLGGQWGAVVDLPGLLLSKERREVHISITASAFLTGDDAAGALNESQQAIHLGDQEIVVPRWDYDLGCFDEAKNLVIKVTVSGLPIGRKPTGFSALTAGQPGRVVADPENPATLYIVRPTRTLPRGASHIRLLVKNGASRVVLHWFGLIHTVNPQSVWDETVFKVNTIEPRRWLDDFVRVRGKALGLDCPNFARAREAEKDLCYLAETTFLALKSTFQWTSARLSPEEIWAALQLKYRKEKEGVVAEDAHPHHDEEGEGKEKEKPAEEVGKVSFKVQIVGFRPGMILHVLSSDGKSLIRRYDCAKEFAIADLETCPSPGLAYRLKVQLGGRFWSGGVMYARPGLSLFRIKVEGR